MKQFTLHNKEDKKVSNHLFLVTDIKTLKENKNLSSGEINFINKAKDKTTFIFSTENGLKYVLVSKENLEANRKFGFQFVQYAKSENNFLWNLHLMADSAYNAAFVEGACLSSYQFNKYKTDAKAHEFTFNVVAGLSSKETAEINEVVEATFICKNLINEPQSYLNASTYASVIKDLGMQFGFKVQTFNKKEIIKHKMGGLLAVNRGSIQEPTFTILEYKADKPKNKKPIVLVGKGVTFDTGGLSLKPTPNSMDLMKSDMGGSAAVVGAFCAIAAQKLNVHVIGLIPATDNRPGLDATAPSDVITMMSGKTVEVLNTDAEGRLILADALHYAKQFKPQLVIDLATLTGAAARAIGSQGIVCMGTADEETKAALNKAGNEVHERLVEFPMWEEYEPMIKSDIADLKNIGGAEAGATTAGMFLKHFTDYPWMHFDIAGPAFLTSTDNYRGKNASGVGVRLLYNYLKNL